MRLRITVAGLLLLMAMRVDAGIDTQFPRHLATLHYENSSGEKGVSFFETDESGLVVRGLWTLEDGSRSSINHYVADDGFIVDTRREFSDGVRLAETAEVIDGRLVAERFERSDGVKGLTRFEYGDDGRIARIVCDRSKGWFTGEIVPSYGPDGRMNLAEIRQKGERTGEIAYDRAPDGRLLREHWDFDGRWSQTFVYEYDECGAADAVAPQLNPFFPPGLRTRLVKETYDFSGETGGPSTFEYDRRGRLIHKTFSRSDGLTTETDYLHDCRGFIRKAWRRYSDGRSAVFSYDFDPEGLLVSRSFVMADGSRGKETYVRDSRGILTSARYDRMDSWLSGILGFEHDESGRLEAGRFEGDDGSSAEIAFAYDDRGNLSSIRWTFSSGHTQAYSFAWEARN